jgi:hypothetical protein
MKYIVCLRNAGESSFETEANWKVLTQRQYLLQTVLFPTKQFFAEEVEI